MATPPPEVQKILDQVQSELAAMILAGETGTVTVHCGVDQMTVKANPERRHEPIRLERARMNVIRRQR